MEPDDEHISTLYSMGFPDIDDIRRALRIGKNDLNEAVAILTNDRGSFPPDVHDTDDDLRCPADAYPAHASHAPPPPYHQAIDGQLDVSKREDSSILEFPTTNLYELEGRVFTDSWSIPYKKEESFGKCLIAATRLAEAGFCDADDNCRRFMDRCMPEAFKKSHHHQDLNYCIIRCSDPVSSPVHFL